MAYGTSDNDQVILQRWSIDLLRAEYQSQPPKLRAETLARVRMLLDAERARRQTVPSYLARHYEEIYG